MKRLGNLYSQVCEIENIKQAIKEAAKGKTQRRFVRRILNNIDYYAFLIKTMLTTGNIKFAQCATKVIRENPTKKERVITIPPFFPNQIIHWALMLVLKPILTKSAYYYSCGSMEGRGITHGKKYVEKVIYRTRNKWCLKADIHHFYPSINNEILLKLFKRKIKDKEVLNLIAGILGKSKKGIPIGFYTSQWFSNFYLEGLDHYIKEDLKIKHYVRYVDDIVLIDSNKRKLQQARKQIQQYLAHYLDLPLKRNWQVFNLYKRSLDFLGFVYHRDKRGIKLRKYTFNHTMRIISHIKHHLGHFSISQARSLISLIGWLKQTYNYNVYRTLIKPVVKRGKLRRVISNWTLHHAR